MKYYINMLTISNINNILDFSFKDDRNTRGIYKMINDLFEYNDIFESDSIILTLIYLRRYKKSNSIINHKNIKDLIETCIILSNKFICDFEISGRGPLEHQVLNNINWNLYVDNEEFESVKSITNSNFIKCKNAVSCY
tara:strand:+ start:4165 stop:4578 length:414 start_codon:yes stop_codon:yes gene_type:complete